MRKKTENISGGMEPLQHSVSSVSADSTDVEGEAQTKRTTTESPGQVSLTRKVRCPPLTYEWLCQILRSAEHMERMAESYSEVYGPLGTERKIVYCRVLQSAIRYLLSISDTKSRRAEQVKRGKKSDGTTT